MNDCVCMDNHVLGVSVLLTDYDCNCYYYLMQMIGALKYGVQLLQKKTKLDGQACELQPMLMLTDMFRERNSLSRRSDMRS